MSQVAEMRTAVVDLAARGEAALPEAMPVMARVGRMMETQLAKHAQKEDEALFPALEAIFGVDGGPTKVMRMEHVDIHAQGELLRKTLRELNDVEHPAIEAGAARLTAMANQAASAPSVKATAEEIIRLLDMHFAKEEQILFPMAENMLDPEAMSEVGKAMEALG